MWQRMCELCDTLADSSGPDRQQALLELLDEGVLEEGCRQAVREGCVAPGALEWCYEILSSSPVKELFGTLADERDGKDQQQAVCQVAAAVAAIEARRLAEHGGSMSSLVQWTARAACWPVSRALQRRLDRANPLPVAPCKAEECVAAACNWLLAPGLDVWPLAPGLDMNGARDRVLALLNAVDGSASENIRHGLSSNHDRSRLRSIMAVVRQDHGKNPRVWDLLNLPWASKQTAGSPTAKSHSTAAPSFDMTSSWLKTVTDEHFTFLSGLLTHSDAHLRHEALALMWQILYANARSQNPASAMSWFTTELPTSLVALCASGVDSERERAVSVVGAFALIGLGPVILRVLCGNARVREALLPLLADPVDVVRAAAAAAVTLSTPPSPALIGRLVPLLDDLSATVRMVAARCLAWFELDASVPGLTGALERALALPDHAMLGSVLTAVGRLRPSAPPAVIRAVVPLLHDPIASIRAAAVRVVTASAETAGTSVVFAAADPIAQRTGRGGTHRARRRDRRLWTGRAW